MRTSGNSCPPDAPEQGRKPLPRPCPPAAIAAPSPITPSSRLRGSDPTASRMPNSRVRPLTENASTPATPTTAIEQRYGREAAEHQRVQPVRCEHLRADVFQRRRALHQLVRGHFANDTRDRRHQRVGVRVRVNEQTAVRRSPVRRGDTHSSPGPAPRAHRPHRPLRRRCAAARC